MKIKKYFDEIKDRVRKTAPKFNQTKSVRLFFFQTENLFQVQKF